MNCPSFFKKQVNRDARGFFKCLANFLKIPPTSIRVPAEKVEMMKGKDSQWIRINDLCWMLALYSIDEHVFHLRADSFHWDLERCVVWKPHVIAREDEYVDNSCGSKKQKHSGTFDFKGSSVHVHDKRIRSRVTYLTNSFVVVNSIEDKYRATIWIGNVLSTISDEKGGVYTRFCALLRVKQLLDVDDWQVLSINLRQSSKNDLKNHER